MSATLLIKDGEKYGGKYVATKSFKDKKVLCSGKNPVRVIEKAKKMGIKNPVILYVFERGMAHIY